MSVFDSAFPPPVLASDRRRLEQLYGSADLLPLWIAEPYVPLAPAVTDALRDRAGIEWYGYETRPEAARESFWAWMQRRHGWDEGELRTHVSPSVGTSLGVLIDRFTRTGDGVIIQPPVFTDFKPLITSAGRNVVRNPLVLENGRYDMDLEGLEEAAAEPATRMMILCSPHNPVGRVWSASELRAVASICAGNDVLLAVDEIHADLTLPPNRFIPFATVQGGIDLAWAAMHGPIKTFGLAGVCDTFLITKHEQVSEQFREVSRRLHLTRNHVFSTSAASAAYREGDAWLDDLLDLVTSNASRIRDGLDPRVGLMTAEATYLAWLDFRALGLDVPDLARWLVDAGLALSPGHWFGRQGAGFARMTIAVPTGVIDDAVGRINAALLNVR